MLSLLTFNVFKCYMSIPLLFNFLIKSWGVGGWFLVMVQGLYKLAIGRVEERLFIWSDIRRCHYIARPSSAGSVIF